LSAIKAAIRETNSQSGSGKSLLEICKRIGVLHYRSNNSPFLNAAKFIIWFQKALAAGGRNPHGITISPSF